MEKSSSITEIAKALMQFHVNVSKVGKDATNPFFKSKYASLGNILDTIKLPLEESGLVFSQFPIGEHGLTSILIHAESGEFISACYEMKPIKDDPQGRGSAITYQRRYALSAILGLNIDEDDDANHATHGKAQPSKKIEPDFSDVVDESMRKELRVLVFNSTLEESVRVDTLKLIDTMSNTATFQRLKAKLQNVQLGYDTVSNASQKDINKKLREINGKSPVNA